MGGEGFGFQLRMELDTDIPGMVRDLDDLGQAAVGREAGKADAVLLETLAIADINLVAMAVTLRDFRRAVDCRHLTPFGKPGRIGAKPHRASLRVPCTPPLRPTALHPFLEIVDDRREPLA